MQISFKNFNELSLEELYEIIKLRIQVFVIEQNCLYQDLDNKDLNSVHVLMKKENQLVAYLRIVDFSDNKAHIGRIVAKVKGQGYGTKLLLETIDYCKLTKNIHKIVLNAQINALNFYKKLNFEISSEEYLIDNIPHVDMELIIDK